MATERVVIQVVGKGTRVVKRDLAAIGTTAQTASKGVALLQKGLIALGGILVIRQAVTTLAEFEQQMATVQAITGATTNEFAAMEETVRDLGATTRFSASQAAEGLVNLTRAGFSAAEAIETVDDTLRLAQAGALDLGTAAMITAGTLRGFRLETHDAARVVDIFALAANRANTDVTLLGEAMKFVAPVAAGVGVSVEETTAAIQALSDANIRGAMAGTGLRTIISRLEAPTAAVQKILARFNLTAEDVNVSSVGLTGALEKLAKAGVGTGDALLLFGQRGGPAFEVLSSSIPKVKEFTKELENADGTAIRIAETMDKNLNGAILAVRSAIEALILSLGKSGGTLDVLEQSIRGLAAALRFLANNIEIVQGLLVGVAIVTLPLVIKGVAALGAVIAANPLGAIILALTTGIGLLVKFKDEIKLTSDGLVSLGDFAGVVFDDLKSALGIVIDFAKEIGIAFTVFTLGIDETEVSFEDFLRSVALIWDTIAGISQGWITAIVTAFKLLPGVMKDIFISMANGIIITIETLINKKIDLVNQFVKKTSLVINAARVLLGKELISIKGIDPVTIKKFTNSAEGQFRTAAGKIIEAFKHGFRTSTAAQDLVDRLFDRARARGMERFGEEFKAGLEEIASKIGPTAEMVGRNLGDILGRAIGSEITSGVTTGIGMLGRAAGVGRAEEEARFKKQLAEATKKFNDEITKEIELAKLSSRESQIRVQMMKVEEDFLSRNIDLTNEATQAELAKIQVRFETLANLQELQGILDELEPSQENEILRAQIINDIMADGIVTTDELTEAKKRLANQMETNTTLLDGIASAFMRVDTSALALGESIGNALVRAVDRSSDALAEFAITGFRNVEDLRRAFANLFQDLGKEIIKLIIKMLLLKSIQVALGGLGFGGGGGGGGNLITALPKAQLGGPAVPGRPMIVGEQGRPEIFVPQERGNIVPAAQALQQPPVNVQVVNVTDRNEIPSVIGETPEGEQAVINVLQKNPDVVRSLAGI